MHYTDTDSNIDRKLYTKKNLEVNKYEIPSRQFVKKSAPIVIENTPF